MAPLAIVGPSRPYARFGAENPVLVDERDLIDFSIFSSYQHDSDIIRSRVRAMRVALYDRLDDLADEAPTIEDAGILYDLFNHHDLVGQRVRELSETDEELLHAVERQHCRSVQPDADALFYAMTFHYLLRDVEKGKRDEVQLQDPETWLPMEEEGILRRYAAAYNSEVPKWELMRRGRIPVPELEQAHGFGHRLY